MPHRVRRPLPVVEVNMGKHDKDELMTPKEIAKELKVGRSKVYGLVKEMGVTRVGGTIRVRRSRLTAWLRANEDTQDGK